MSIRERLLQWLSSVELTSSYHDLLSLILLERLRRMKEVTQ
jgi:hypothetical protein